MASVYPQKESELVSWSLNLVTVLTANSAGFGVTGAMCTDLATKRTAFVADWNVCQVPETKTAVAVQAKAASKRTLCQAISAIAAVAQNFPGTTNEMRAQAGLPLRDDGQSPINPPAFSPFVEVKEVSGRRVSLKVRGPDAERRGKPVGVSAISVWYFAGAAPPADLDEYENIGEVTRMDFDIEFPTSLAAGSLVWLVLFFRNPRMQSGPICSPIQLYLGGGVSQQA